MDIIKRIVAPGHGTFAPPNPIYFAVHSTANPGATAANHVTYWSREPNYAVHFVSDWSEAYQCVELDRVCWQVGNGNRTCIGLEICEPNGYDYDKFIRGLEIARSVILQTLDRYGWTIDGAVRSHKWFTQTYGGSDHTDPIPYFNRYGWNWDMFVNYLKEGDIVTPQDMDEIARKVWERYWGDKPMGAMVRETYDEAIKTNDPTGRGNNMRDHEHIKWIGKAVTDLQAGQKEIMEALAAIAAKTN